MGKETRPGALDKRTRCDYHLAGDIEDTIES